MLNLIAKDLRAVALFLCLIVPNLGLLVFGSLLAGKVFLILSSAMAAILVTVAPAVEYSLGVDTFVHSLPVGRADVVKARYATSLLLAGAGLTVAGGMAVIFAANVVARTGAWPAWVTVETALTAMIYVSVYVSIFLASVFRFGFATGQVVSALAVALLIALGFGRIDPGALARLTAAVGLVPAVASVILAAALMIWLSMRISMRSHERREF